jgi:oligo-1,6-glucosidase
MLAFRKEHAETLVFGDFEPLAVDDGPVFAYWRRCTQGLGEKDVLVVLNMTAKTDVVLALPGDGAYTTLATTNGNGQTKTAGALKSGQEVSLSAYEGMVFEYSLQ